MREDYITGNRSYMPVGEQMFPLKLTGERWLEVTKKVQ